jgi:dihydroflavonol-4-reductase
MNNHASAGKTLVTGATGLVGNNVIRLLCQQRSEVRVLVRDSSNLHCLEDLDVEIVHGDVTDEQSVNAAVRGVQAVVHAAGCILLGWKNVELHDRVNRLGAQHIARAARQANARLVHVSSINALGVGQRERPGSEDWVAGPNIPCPYVQSKQAGEQAVQKEIESGLDAVIVYPGFMLGPWDWKPSSGKMLVEVARKLTPFAPVGGFSVGDVRDVAQAIVTILQSVPASRHYVLAGHNMTYFEAWKRFAQVSGGHGPICRGGPLMRVAAGFFGDLWGNVTGHEPDVNSAAVQLSNRFHYFSSARAERELNYQIRDVDETIRDAWQWLTDHGYA